MRENVRIYSASRVEVFLENLFIFLLFYRVILTKLVGKVFFAYSQNIAIFSNMRPLCHITPLNRIYEKRKYEAFIIVLAFCSLS